MAHYKAYVTDPGGHLIEVTDIICASDSLAILVAESMTGPNAIDLCEHERQVARFAGTAM